MYNALLYINFQVQCGYKEMFGCIITKTLQYFANFKREHLTYFLFCLFNVVQGFVAKGVVHRGLSFFKISFRKDFEKVLTNILFLALKLCQSSLVTDDF